jgi:type IV secretion system protein TrbI
MSAREIKAPTGLDINPRPPVTVRLSKRAGIIFILLIGGAVALVSFGIYSRQQKQSRPALGPANDRNIVAATDAGQQIAQELSNAKTLNAPRDAVRSKEKLELQAAEDLKSTHAAAKSGTPVPNQTAKTRLSQPVVYHSAPQPGYHEPTAEEKRLQLAYQREQEAIAASTKVSLPEGLQATTAKQSSPDRSQLETLVRNLLNPGASTAPPASPKLAASENQNKTMFAGLQQKLLSSRTPQSGHFEIKSGWNIPAILEQDINSDLPGEIRALVRESVYDTATGHWLLIPQGARLLGAYDSRVAYGQEVVQVAWNRIIYPDGSSIDLNGMVGQDASGASGFRDDVDHHYKRLVGMGLLTSAFSAAFQLSQNRHGSTLDYPGAGETAGSAVGQQMSQLGIDVTRRNLDVQPTIKVRAGYRFNVRVNRDLVFDRPYQ